MKLETLRKKTRKTSVEARLTLEDPLTRSRAMERLEAAELGEVAVIEAHRSPMPSPRAKITGT